MAGQSGDSLERAVATGQLDGVVADKLLRNDQLNGNLDAKQSAALARAAGGVASAPASPSGGAGPGTPPPTAPGTP